MNKKILIGAAIVFVAVVLVGAYMIFDSLSGKQAIQNSPEAVMPSPNNKITLSYAVHWTEKQQMDGVYLNGKLVSKGLNQYLAEYSALHPNITFSVQVIPYAKYANRLKTLSDAGIAPDIYQIYSPWAVSYVQAGILDTPPASIQDDVRKNYVSIAGVTIKDKIWGIPTEINDYVLLYNKKIFKEAGLLDAQGAVAYPKTWNELVSAATRLAKKDANGNLIRYGIAFSSEDWQVVDPFLALLFSNGGQYLSPDFKKSLFNGPEGVQALSAELELFRKGATDINGNFFDFAQGKVAMVIAPPWVKANIQAGFGNEFESTVGVAPLPSLKDPRTLGYSWFMGVMDGSKHKKEAWDFLAWLTSDVQPETGTTRYGDLLANTIGAIPSRKTDFERHADALGDFFTKTYVEQMKNAVPEPNVAESADIKAALLEEIQSAWTGKKTAQQALDAAAVKVDKILDHYYQ